MTQFTELFIHSLGISTAKALLRRNMSTMLAYFAPDETETTSQARILHLIGCVFLSNFTTKMSNAPVAGT